MIGRVQLGAYEVIAELGRGETTVVYRARAPEGQDVALKVFRSAEPDDFARFQRERRLLGGVGFAEGFVPLVAAGQSPDGPYLVMPFLSGGTLRARLEHGALEIRDAVAIGRALGVALGKIHARAIVHRDLKPENVLFTGGDSERRALGGGARSPPSFAGGGWGRPFIADLGLAKHFRRDVKGATRSISVTVSGQVLGTLGYMPLEQLSGGDVRAAADVFALGAILYECITSRPAFTGANVIDVARAMMSGRLEPIRRVRPETPHGIAAAIERALAKDAAARFENGTAFARALGAEHERATD